MPKLRNILAAKGRAAGSKVKANLTQARNTDRGERVIAAGANMLAEQMNQPMESTPVQHALGVGEQLSPLQSRTQGPSHGPIKEE